MKQIQITAHRTATLAEVPEPDTALAPNEVRGRTVVSLCSPGTEVNHGFLAKAGFPIAVGYASVFEVEEVGSAVTDVSPGALVFGSGGHASRQRCERRDVTPLPDGLKPETAVFARLAGVSMSTLNTTTARAPSRVLVTGLGPVGNLAAQIFSICGYQVTGIDPVEARRKLAQAHGLVDVRATLGEGDLSGKVALHVECSGHEQAVLDGVKSVRRRGEVVLVGVPWHRRTDLYAHELLHAIFHRYVVVRSGWEWEVPRHPAEFSGSSITENYIAALQWLAQGRLRVDGMAELHPATDAERVYESLAQQSLPTPTALFGWR
jgi:threonine dehydrogenase-like Zn-dependent dehydrogenase